MDRWGDHALVCCCHGDRTLRHNAVRDVTFQEAVDAALQPEREKAGLLPARPAQDGLGPESDGRRPADIWLPRGTESGAEALDFAVTSGLQAALYRRVAENTNVVFDHYEAFKRSFKNTEQACKDQNLRFSPMILEAHGGGWSSAFRRTVDWIARNAAAANHEDATVVSLRIAQRISCSLHRENARAILKRKVQPAALPAMSSWLDASDDAHW